MKLIKMSFVILLLIIFFYLVCNNQESLINYNRSNKTITKDQLMEYDDPNKSCKINEELLKDDDYSKVFNKDKIQDVYITVNNMFYYLLENFLI